MGKALAGTFLRSGRAARVNARIVLAGMALLLGAGLLCPAAEARPDVCCFRITVELTGQVEANYTKVDPTDSQGSYDYTWNGAARGLGHLQGSSGFQTDRGVETGFLDEQNFVTNSEGPRDSSDPDCKPGQETGSARDVFIKTRHGYPNIFLGGHGGFGFGPPFIGWELKCSSLDTESNGDLRQGNPDFPGQRQFFDSTSISARRGLSLSARQLAKGHTQTVTCYEHSSPRAIPTRRTIGFFAVMVTIVRFPADDLKHQQRRLTAFVGTRDEFTPMGRPMDRTAFKFFNGKPVPGNGCHTG
jgi:hypothetical protein